MAEIWIINPYASPPAYGWPSRSFHIAKELKNRGHIVTVFSFTGSHYLHLKNDIKPRKSPEQIEGINFVWLPSIRFFKDSLIIRWLNWYLFNFFFRNFINKNKCKAPVSVLFSIPSVHHLDLIKVLKNRYPSMRSTLEMRDLWPLSVSELSKKSNKHFFIRHLKKKEILAVKEIDRIVGLQPGIKEYIKRDHPYFSIDKVHFIPHTIDSVKLDKSEIVYDFIYCGTLSRANDLDTFLDALIRLESEKVFFNVLIIGAGSSCMRLKKKADKLRNTQVKPWMQRSDVLQNISKAKVCVDGLLNLPMYQFGFSRLKWVDYMAMGKPILVSYSGSPIDVPIDKIGWQVPAENVDSMAIKIVEIFENQDEIDMKGVKAQDWVYKNRAIDLWGGHYEDILLEKN